MKESLISVGIDIGTSTTQLVFSKITIENTAAMISVPRIQIVDKEIIYRSDIHFTPLTSDTEINGDAVRDIVSAEYRKAGISQDEVATGAVIITGETARKENAAEVQKALSRFAGEFVVATAGPSLEGIVAGKGAGACEMSRERGNKVVNLDIGGGTTNIAVFSNGDVLDTACLDIGGRLIQVSGGRISYMSTKIRALCKSNGIPLEVGQKVDPDLLKQVTRRMAELLEEVVGVRPATPDLELIATDHDLRRDYPIDMVSFSGGVADCIPLADTNVEDFAFGDIGILLGRAIGASAIFSEKEMFTPVETIRATVVGAGSHTMDVSGSTISVSDAVLPIQNVPVLKLAADDEKRPFAEWAAIIRQKVEWFRQEGGHHVPALAFSGSRNVSFAELQVLAANIIEGMDAVIQEPTPLIVVVESDLGKSLGQTLRAQLAGKKDVICIDTVCVENGDYIDVGKSVAEGSVVPVIVKTLLFNY